MSLRRGQFLYRLAFFQGMLLRGLQLVAWVILLNTSFACAKYTRWKNAVDGNWETAGNWDTGRVPSKYDEVVIDAVGTYTVTMSTASKAASVYIGSSTGTQTLKIGNTLSVQGYFVAASTGIVEIFNAQNGAIAGYNGELKRANELEIAGTLKTLSGSLRAHCDIKGTLSASGSSVEFKEMNATISGALQWTSGSITLLNANFTIASGGKLDISANADALLSSNGNVQNNGSVSVSLNNPSNVAKVHSNFTNVGAIAATQGTLCFIQKATFESTSSVSGTSGVQFKGGENTIAGSYTAKELQCSGASTKVVVPGTVSSLAIDTFLADEGCQLNISLAETSSLPSAVSKNGSYVSISGVSPNTLTLANAQADGGTIELAIDGSLGLAEIKNDGKILLNATTKITTLSEEWGSLETMKDINIGSHSWKRGSIVGPGIVRITEISTLSTNVSKVIDGTNVSVKGKLVWQGGELLLVNCGQLTADVGSEIIINPSSTSDTMLASASSSSSSTCLSVVTVNGTLSSTSGKTIVNASLEVNGKLDLVSSHIVVSGLNATTGSVLIDSQSSLSIGGEGGVSVFGVKSAISGTGVMNTFGGNSTFEGSISMTNITHHNDSVVHYGPSGSLKSDYLNFRNSSQGSLSNEFTVNNIYLFDNSTVAMNPPSNRSMNEISLKESSELTLPSSTNISTASLFLFNSSTLVNQGHISSDMFYWYGGAFTKAGTLRVAKVGNVLGNNSKSLADATIVFDNNMTMSGQGTTLMSGSASLNISAFFILDQSDGSPVNGCFIESDRLAGKTSHINNKGTIIIHGNNPSTNPKTPCLSVWVRNDAGEILQNNTDIHLGGVEALSNSEWRTLQNDSASTSYLDWRDGNISVKLSVNNSAQLFIDKVNLQLSSPLTLEVNSTNRMVGSEGKSFGLGTAMLENKGTLTFLNDINLTSTNTSSRQLVNDGVLECTSCTLNINVPLFEEGNSSFTNGGKIILQNEYVKTGGVAQFEGTSTLMSDLNTPSFSSSDLEVEGYVDSERARFTDSNIRGFRSTPIPSSSTPQGTCRPLDQNITSTRVSYINGTIEITGSSAIDVAVFPPCNSAKAKAANTTTANVIPEGVVGLIEFARPLSLPLYCSVSLFDSIPVLGVWVEIIRTPALSGNCLPRPVAARGESNLPNVLYDLKFSNTSVFALFTVSLCANVCANGGLCVNGECDCPSDYFGPTCALSVVAVVVWIIVGLVVTILAILVLCFCLKRQETERRKDSSTKLNPSVARTEREVEEKYPWVSDFSDTDYESEKESNLPQIVAPVAPVVETHKPTRTRQDQIHKQKQGSVHPSKKQGVSLSSLTSSKIPSQKAQVASNVRSTRQTDLSSNYSDDSSILDIIGSRDSFVKKRRKSLPQYRMEKEVSNRSLPLTEEIPDYHEPDESSLGREPVPLRPGSVLDLNEETNTLPETTPPSALGGEAKPCAEKRVVKTEPHHEWALENEESIENLTKLPQTKASLPKVNAGNWTLDDEELELESEYVPSGSRKSFASAASPLPLNTEPDEASMALNDNVYDNPSLPSSSIRSVPRRGSEEYEYDQLSLPREILDPQSSASASGSVPISNSSKQEPRCSPSQSDDSDPFAL
eukprot:Nk52_evm4s1607 gene=Nk52_evmTU4s1607